MRRGRLIGTYLHGPLLPKNVWLADRLIEWALERRYGSAPALEPLDDGLEAAAHRSALEAALGKAAQVGARSVASGGSSPTDSSASRRFGCISTCTALPSRSVHIWREARRVDDDRRCRGRGR